MAITEKTTRLAKTKLYPIIRPVEGDNPSIAKYGYEIIGKGVEVTTVVTLKNENITAVPAVQDSVSVTTSFIEGVTLRQSDNGKVSRNNTKIEIMDIKKAFREKAYFYMGSNVFDFLYFGCSNTSDYRKRKNTPCGAFRGHRSRNACILSSLRSWF